MFVKPLIISLVFVLTVIMSSCTSSPTTTNVEVVSENKPSPTPTKTPSPPKMFESDEKLQKQSDALLNLFGQMPSVPVYIKDEPILKTGSETQKGVAYTSCELKNTPVIYVKKIFYKNANQKQLTNILKHELTHAWFCRQGVQAGHDPRFRKKFKEIGGIGN